MVVVDHTSVAGLVEALKAYRKRRGFAASSQHRNGHYLRAFGVWAGDRQVGDIAAAQIEQGFLAEWCESFEHRNGRQPSQQTLRNLIKELRALYAYADRFDLLVDADGQIVRNPMPKIESPKIRRVIKEWLEPEEFDQLPQASMNPDELFTVAWLGMTAMRIAEAGQVTWRDVDLAGGTILIRSGKSDEAARRLAMSGELQAHVRRHLQRQRERGLADPTTPVFCTKHGNPIREQQANRTLKRLATRAGINKRISCHGLRRSWAMHAVKLMSIESVAAHLGHADSATTAAHYARVQFAQVEEEFRRAFG
jgi:integrase/recombinase XerD